MGNKSSTFSTEGISFRDDESLDIIERLQRICEVMQTPSDNHNLRILIKSTINITSRNPHILLQIAEWYKMETQCIPFNFEILSSRNSPNSTNNKNNSNRATTTDRDREGDRDRDSDNSKRFVFKLTLSKNNDITNDQFIEYINNRTLYNLNCVINNDIDMNGISSFISCSYNKDKILNR